MNANERKIARQSVGECAQPQTQPLCCPRILVVDDDPYTRAMNAGILMWSGYDVQSVANGDDAWKALDVFNYDLLITENEMELERNPWLHLDGVLLKPFNIFEFVGVVKKVLNGADDVANSAPFLRNSAMRGNNIRQMNWPDGTAPQSSVSSTKRILVVDDDNDARQLNIKVLVDSGYDVDGVRDGAAGWDALQARNYNLVITDNKMPRMTGVEMITKLRSASMPVPVIMATGNLPTQEFINRPWLKPDATLQKPFSPDDLLAMVENVLNPDNGSSTGQGQPLPNGLPL